jgi:hypothetical protein
MTALQRVLASPTYLRSAKSEKRRHSKREKEKHLHGSLPRFSSSPILRCKFLKAGADGLRLIPHTGEHVS